MKKATDVLSEQREGKAGGAVQAEGKAVWIDTHNHLFALPEAQREEEVERAKRAGVIGALICAGDPSHFDECRRLAHASGFSYALGLHPLYLSSDFQSELLKLEKAIEENIGDPALAAIGESGLDLPNGKGYSVPAIEIQEKVLDAHIRLSARFALPLSLHGRGAMDLLYKHLRKYCAPGGVIHAFNGSSDQAAKFLALGFKLGYGGAMTYEGSKRIRRIFSELPDNAWVLETDCPDMPSSERREKEGAEAASRLEDIAAYGHIAAELRGRSLLEASGEGLLNSFAAFPKIKERANYFLS